MTSSFCCSRARQFSDKGECCRLEKTLRKSCHLSHLLDSRSFEKSFSGNRPRLKPKTFNVIECKNHTRCCNTGQRQNVLKIHLVSWIFLASKNLSGTSPHFFVYEKGSCGTGLPRKLHRGSQLSSGLHFRRFLSEQFHEYVRCAWSSILAISHGLASHHQSSLARLNAER